MSPWLIDKSAITRLHLDPEAMEWAPRIERGVARICTVWLKSEHGLGHGHANAIVAHVRAEPRH